MYKIKLVKGVAYFDPETKIHLTLGNKTKVIDEELEEKYDMSNIEYAIKLGTLEKIDMDNTDEDFITEEELFEEDENQNEEDQDQGQDQDETRCQAITGSGEQCKNTAIYPEEEPKYCGVHKGNLDE